MSAFPSRIVLAAAVTGVALAPAHAQVEWAKPVVLTNPNSGSGYGATRFAACEASPGEVILVGDDDGAGRIRTWRWLSTAWEAAAAATTPPSRFGHSMAYDALRGRVVLFGGFDPGNPFSVMGDTWEWDGSTWSQRTPATNPPARYGHRMAFDSARGRTVLFGGLAGFVPFADTWEWDGNDWTPVPAAGPSARFHSSLVYDPVRGRTLLFGGAGAPGTSIYGDTWEWNGVTWTQRFPGSSPAARFDHALTFDAARGVAVMSGGYGGFVLGVFYFFADTWEWDGTTWQLRTTLAPQLRRRGHVLAYDSIRQQSVLFGGTQGDNITSSWPSDTWEWDGATWAQRAPPTHPEGSIDSLTFDPVHQEVVGFDLSRSEAWSWNGSAWSHQSFVGPPYRTGYAVATDPVRNRVVLFGGSTGSGRLDDTWEWDGNAWSHATPSVHPSQRQSHAMSFCSSNQHIVLFGGDNGAPLGDTWEWDGSSWTQHNPALAPLPRWDAAMADDEAHGGVVLFGGWNGASLTDTWVWDGTTWQLRTTTGPQLSPMRMVYDRPRGRVVLFGQAQTWEWDGAAWSQRVTAATPENGLLAFDPIRDRTVQYGFATWEYGPTFPAMATPFGSGCAGSTGVPLLGATALPWLGDTLHLQVTNLAPGVPLVAIAMGFSDQLWAGVTLPSPLQTIGMPTCYLLISLEGIATMNLAGGIATFDLAVPNQPTLLGLTFFHQAAVLEPGINPASLVVSNGLRADVGGR